MPGKMIQCGKCRKVMRSDNLKNHMKTHDKSSPFCTFPNSINSGSGVSLPSYRNRKRTHENITGSGVDLSDNQQKIQKLRLFVDEIIGDTRESSDEEAEKLTSPGNIKKVLGRLNCDVPQTGKVGKDPEYITADEDLSIIFQSLWKDKITNLWELVMIISIWLYRGYISPNQFQEINKIILSSQKCKIEEMDDETLIQATVDYFTKDDKLKLKKIIGQFKRVDNSDKVQEFERAIEDDKYFFD